eukprot:13330618-Alexandrium_andersonii.AAC.1
MREASCVCLWANNASVRACRSTNVLAPHPWIRTTSFMGRNAHRVTEPPPSKLDILPPQPSMG